MSAVIATAALVAAAPAFAQDVCRPNSAVASRYQPINVQFDTGSTVISATDRQRIADMAKVAKASKIQQICIKGFADKQGDPAMNKRLSQARAEAVAQEFGKHGVGRDYVALEGAGEPGGGALFGAMQTGSQADRRVEIRIAR